MHACVCVCVLGGGGIRGPPSPIKPDCMSEAVPNMPHLFERAKGANEHCLEGE